MRVRTFVVAGAVAATATMLASGIASADPATIPGDGFYRVGVDIQPGIYQAPGTPDPAHGCFWRRVNKEWTPADPNHNVVASDFTLTTPVRTLIKPTDAAFETRNCGAWVMVPPPPNTGSYGPGGWFGSEY